MGRRTIVVALVLGLAAATAGVGGAADPAGAAPSTVTIAGSFQSELGCPGDWQPECPLTQLTLDPDDGVWQASFTLPAGDWAAPRIASAASPSTTIPIAARLPITSFPLLCGLRPSSPACPSALAVPVRRSSRCGRSPSRCR